MTAPEQSDEALSQERGDAGLWARGTASSVGSWPGTDPLEAARVIVGETPHLPALPELPGRGAGSDMVGRTLALLPDLPGIVVPSGWRFTALPGADMRRAAGWLRQDLDAFEEVGHEHPSPVKLQIAGPFTLAAAVELASGERAISDHGARRDIVAAVAEAAAAHAREVRRRLPHADGVIVQIDEPSIRAVLDARIRTASGYRTYRSIDVAEARTGLASLVEALHDVGAAVAIHCCADRPPLEVLLAAGPDALSLDAASLMSDTYDTMAEAIDTGTALLLGAVPTSGDERSVTAAAQVLRRWWSDLGFAPEELSAVAITPACGLSGATPSAARAVLARCRDLATAVLEDPDGDHTR
jgi:methionine synthase II (cobalamin-independent)